MQVRSINTEGMPASGDTEYQPWNSGENSLSVLPGFIVPGEDRGSTHSTKHQRKGSRLGFAMTEDGGWLTRRRVTLNDVAKHAHVSRALVSIVMRDAPGASPATRERVWAAARELGYRPDVRARSLAGQKSRLIGVMFGVGIGTFQFDLLEGLYAAAEEHGHSLMLTPVTRGRDEHRAARSLHDFGFDALIMLGPPTPKPLLTGKVPIAVVGWHVDDPAVDVVRASDEHGMALAVDHLVGLGHHRIAYIDGGATVIAAARREGYQKAMHDYAMGAYIRVIPGGQSQLDGQRAVRALLSEGDLPTALLAYNDDTAVAAMGLLAQRDIQVPGQLSIIGWDDAEVAALSPVGLTTVAQDPMEMARLAVERIVARIEGRRVEGHEIVLEPELRVRASTGPNKNLMS
jgi:DNA-binding LacI/PurR family transcriptional regulator